MNNISLVSENHLCSNCGACKAICPKDAISFEWSSIGRMFAVPNGKCIDCGLCLKACPSVDKADLHLTFPDRYMGEVKRVYTGRCTDLKIFDNAQSGGACTALLSWMFDKKLIDAAVVTAMSPGKPPKISSSVVTGKEELHATQKSCYTPVDTLSALKNATSYDTVALVGLPCHIQGLRSLHNLGKFKNVRYAFGLICESTLCRSVQDAISSLSENESDYQIVWKAKAYQDSGRARSYSNAPVVVTYGNGEEFAYDNSVRFALKGMFTPPRCRVCHDKINTFADVVFGDPWRMSDIDWDNGESLVVTRTPIGDELVSSAISGGALLLKERSLQELAASQLIEQRRMSVALYSKALDSLPHSLDSYLYAQNDREVTERDVQNARAEVQKFLDKDEADIDAILDEARKVIRARLKHERRSRNIIFRILRKIKKTFI